MSVSRLFETEPRIAVFSAAEAGAMTPKTLVLHNEDTTDVTIVSVVDSTALVLPLEVGMLIPAGGAGILTLQARPIGEQSRHGKLTITTSSRRQPLFYLRYAIEGQGEGEGGKE